tara:strand:+ start:181 stop:1569 length:1389 start_codon:yes stop_codon:yes gene_type:complete
MTDINVALDTSEGFIIRPGEESVSQWMAAFPSYDGLLAALGTSDERAQGYMEVSSVSAWYQRLTSTYQTGWYITETNVVDGEEIVTYVNQTPDGNADGNWRNGPDKNSDGTTIRWSSEWWAIHNYLQYGGKCIISGALDNKPETTNNVITTLKNLPLDINCVFTNNPSYNPIIVNIVDSREDCIAVCPVIVTGPTSKPSNMQGIPGTEKKSKLTYHIAGQKLHLGTSQSYTIGDSTSEELISTPLSSDAAGCMARVNASSSPYGSIAGINPGRILDIVRMEYIPTSADIALLAANKVNTTRTFQGSGTVIFADKTGKQPNDSDPDIFEYINVSLTYLYLNRAVSNAIRPFLFRTNDSSTRASLVNSVTPILRNLQASGGITDYRLVCDATNNPQTVVDSNGLFVDLVITFARSIQNITLRFSSKAGNQSVTSSVAGSGGSSSTSSSSSSSSSSTSSSSGSSY